MDADETRRRGPVAQRLRNVGFCIRQGLRKSRRFARPSSSGRDLVFYCGNTPHVWNPDLFRRHGFAGSEEAVIHLARALAALGWRVTVYNHCGHDPVFDGGVIYRPFWEFSPWDRQDIVVLWRNASLLDLDIAARRIFVDLHDVPDPHALSPARLRKVEKIFVKSRFHRSLLPHVPDAKFAIVPNGLDLSLLDGTEARDPYLLVNTSSPDRSMGVLPGLFVEVKKRVPAARLQWAYGWEGFRKHRRKDSDAMAFMERAQREIDAAGIETLGFLNQTAVCALYRRAAIFAYPTEFPEIDCISARKAQACGCVPVTTDCGALAETVQAGIKIPAPAWNAAEYWSRTEHGLRGAAAQQAWIDAVVGLLTDPPQREAMAKAGIAWAGRCAWQEVAAQWNAVLDEALASAPA